MRVGVGAGGTDIIVDDIEIGCSSGNSSDCECHDNCNVDYGDFKVRIYLAYNVDRMIMVMSKLQEGNKDLKTLAYCSFQMNQSLNS